MNYAIILAGGVGSRFWPLSRQTEPKQFLRVCSGKPMIDETIDRIAPLIKKENIYIATNKMHKEKIKEFIKRQGIMIKNVLFEPEGRNTFPPIIVLTQRINKIDPEAVISVLPCDHAIENDEKFVELLAKAISVSGGGNIITFGVSPKRPETGYGYIKIRAGVYKSTRAQATRAQEGTRAQVYRIDKFIEKPDLATAKRLIKDKKYYWNSGIFVFKAEALMSETKRLLPDVYRILNSARDSNRLWASLPATSMDYAIMERTKNSLLMPVDYGWLDLGSWQAIQEVMQKDKSGNIFKGKCLDIESKNTFVWSQDRLVASVGLRDVIIVDTKDALLVCAKDKTQDVKKLVQALRLNKFKEQL